MSATAWFRWLLAVGLLWLAAGIAGCADTPPSPDDPDKLPWDKNAPWEGNAPTLGRNPGY